MKQPAEPPRLARRILGLALPADVREEICGDLEEVFQHRCASHGSVRARLWYGREAVLFSGRFLIERLRGRVGRSGEPAHTDPLGRIRRAGILQGAPSWLDFKLGIRMLIKHPGLTLVGGLAMSVVIAIGATFFDVINDFLHPTLPFQDGARIVGIQSWDAAENARERWSLHDFVGWREEVRSVEELGAFTRLERNLITRDGTAELVEGAAITASAFRLLRVRPLVGRPLLETDEQEGAASVVVLGHGLWQSRFGADSSVVGRVVKVGASSHTVVGVMPEGFVFPVRNELWVPLRFDVSQYERGQGPGVWIFGRLADGVTLEEAQTELATIGPGATAEFPSVNEHLRPRVVPYGLLFSSPETWTVYGIQILFITLLVLVCGNVATLVLARTATRQAEIVVRNALGASRSRIVLQILVETLLLASLASLVGVAAAAWAQNRLLGISVAGIGVPFWSNPDLAPATVLYVAGLTIVGALVTGLIPALKVTGSGVATRLRHVDAGGVSRIRFGSVWTGVIVAQVALIVAFLPSVILLGWDAARPQSIDTPFSPEEYLAVQLDMDLQALQGVPAGPQRLERFRAAYGEVRRRVAAEPGVAGVTFASRLPGVTHPRRPIEVDGVSRSLELRLRHEVSIASIDPDFFDVLGVAFISGRTFDAGDVESGRRVIVSQSFVQQVLGGRSPTERRIRYARGPGEEQGPWYDVVGVVPDLIVDPRNPGEAAAVYHPLTSNPVVPVAAHPVLMAVHLEDEPESFASRLRTIGAEVDATIRLRGFVGVDELVSSGDRERSRIFSVLALATIAAVLLSAAGIYSLVSFTVSQRTREIGIRGALGAQPRRIVAAILSRVLAQIGLGVVAGGLLIALLHGLIADMAMSVGTLGVITAAAAGMMLVALLACALPARRALRIQPTEALRDGG